MRDFHFPGRSTAHGANGMAATSHPTATLAAIDILRSGGNAVDAAIAAAAVLAVVEPQATGIGGDCFCVYAPGGDMAKAIAVNGSGKAPAKATPEFFQGQGLEHIGLTTAHAVSVPGAVDAWTRVLAEYGTLGLDRVLAAAIGYAEDGYVVAPRIQKDWADHVDKLALTTSAASKMLINGRAPKVGEIMKNPWLADTLRAIAENGREGFYAGPVAEDIVSYLNSLGGVHSLDDFAAQDSEFLDPITSTYRDYAVSTVPPSNPGLTTLMILNILEGFDLASYGPTSTERLHLMAEATRLAYNAREEAVGDPNFVDVDVETLISKQWAEEARSKIRLDQTMDLPYISPPAHPDTVYLSVVDKDRNTMSFINSIFYSFGSGLVTPNTGIVLQNRGAGFHLKPGHPNCIAPGKRPLHTITPGMLSKDGRAVMSYGVMGGQYQPVGQTQVVTNVVDYDMDAQEAIDLPRSFWFEGTYQLEKGIPAETKAGLETLGHKCGPIDPPHGGGQAIKIDWDTGTLEGGSDPRKDGIALGY
ncbi:MAG: gamma-glutamyltransferase [Rhodospirillales bacterium]|nr:gamma-glutamyltransferase [Rhodospirillales bacterium]